MDPSAVPMGLQGPGPWRGIKWTFAGVVEEVLRPVGISAISGSNVHYPKEKLLTQVFSIESNLSIYAL